MDRVGDLTLFLRVLDLGSITAAAHSLDLSVAVASQRLKRLEKELGVRLLHRTTRRLHPTPEGLALAQQGRVLVEELESLGSGLREAASEVAGTLRVTMSASFGRQYVSPLLPAFLARHPKVRLSVHLSDNVVDLVSEGFDLAIRIGRLPDSGLIARRLGSIAGAVVASPGYLARAGTPRTVDELRDHACLRYQEHARMWSVPGLEVPIGPGTAVNSTLGQLQVALGGGGLALLADYLAAPHVASGALVRVLEGEVRSRIDVHAVHL